MRGRPEQALVGEKQARESSITQDSYRSQTRDSTADTEVEFELSTPIDDQSSSVPRHYVESQLSIGDQLAELTISSPTAPQSSNRLLSPDIALPSVEGADLITVRDLPNATPRASPSPEPSHSSTLGTYSETNESRRRNGTANQSQTGDLPNLEALSLSNDEVHFVPYNVSAEALPPNPCFDRDYQEALKKAKALAGNVYTHLSQCEVANRADTQLHKIQQRALQLNHFDSPAIRTIGIVGDSAAGTSLLFHRLASLTIPTREEQSDQFSTSFARSGTQGQRLALCLIM